MKKYLLSMVVILSSTAYADLVGSFAAVTKQGKGPFSLNYLQGTESRNEVTSGKIPKGYLFQAAFRNEKAKTLAKQDDFYLGNLFTTNYYELMGEYVYNDAYGSHGVDQKALVAKKTEAIAKAASMVRHWVLEKYYIERLPTSPLAKAFQYRGISGSEFEQKFAPYFFNFYISAISEDFHYLPAYLLAQKSPIGGSNSLEKARSMIAETYDFVKAKFGSTEKKEVASMYRIRNAIHNQLSQGVIAMIDQYDKDFPYYRREKNTYLFEIRKILVDYYSFSVAEIAKMAKDLKLDSVKAAADAITSEGSNPKTLYALSSTVADLKSEIQNTDALILAAMTSQYLSKEINKFEKIEDTEIFEIILNAVYIEGFLIKDNWEEFKIDLAKSTSVDSANQQMADILTIGQATLDSAFEPALGQWISIEPKMQNFRDDTIKSSALNLISLVDQKLKPTGN